MMPRLAVLLLASSAVAIIPAGTLAAESVRPITHEDLWLMPRVADPVISPNGRFAVFQLTRPAYDSDKQASHLWVVATDGSAPARQVTHVRSGESGVTWSPDSRKIAFTTKREGDEAAQVYVLDLASGGEAVPVTSLSTGARLPRFSPDGQRIAFTSDVPAGSRNDADSRRIKQAEEEHKHEVLIYSSFPIRNWDRWLPARQPRLMVQVLGEDAAVDVLADSELVTLPGFAARTTAGGSEFDAVWTPDGKSLVFVASRNRDRAAFAPTNTDLWQVPATGGEPRRLTGGDALDAGDSWSAPAFSPDGRSLYALRHPASGFVYNAARLARLDWPGAVPNSETTLPDARSVSEFAVSPDSRELFMLADDAGHVKLYRGGARGGEARLAFDMDQGIYTNLSVNAQGGSAMLVASFQSAISPAEVVRIDLRRGAHQRLTGFAVEAAAKLDLQPVEHFWFENERGARVHSMLVRPAGFDPERKYPLVVMMHGGPHMMSSDYFFLRWNYHLLAGTEYVVLWTNYTGSTGFGEAFAQAIQGDPLRGPANEINQAADEAIARYDFIDGARQCAGGASYGGHLANWLQGTTERYRCLISHAGLVNLEAQWGTSDIAYSREANLGGPHWEDLPVWREQNPIRYAARWRTPVLVTAGQNDYRVPVNNTLEYWTALQRQRVESRLLVYPNEHHWILNGHNSRHFYGEIADWLARWLGDE
jgi:dipeptidyl aminopeptidase/acylaminoacyl peptidase